MTLAQEPLGNAASAGEGRNGGHGGKQKDPFLDVRFSDAHRLGFSIFPVPAGSKQPAVEWKRYQTERASLDQARAWDTTDANVGYAMGLVSGAFALDVDSPEAEAEARIRHWIRDDTACVKTARGRHFYYRLPLFLIGNRTKLAGVPGIDIRGAGGFVIGAGSVHPNGHVYYWENHPDDVPIADAPAALLDALRSKHRGPRMGAQRQDRDRFSDDPELAALEAQLTNAEEGERNDLLNRVGFRLGQLIAAGRTKREDWEERVRAAARACGLPEDEIDQTLYRAIADGEANPREGDTGPCLADFYALMPTHSYIFAPSRECWPSSSVNSRVPPITIGDVTTTANRWLDQHRAVEQITWAPGEPLVIPDRLIADGGWIDRPGCNVFNQYRKATPPPGDAAKAGPWLDHLHRAYPNDAEHIIDWLAHRVQYPHEKLNHALVMGGAQGVGKDTILEPVKAAIGPWNWADVSPNHMLGRFTGFAKSVILRVSEARDLGDVDRFKFHDHMKTYIAAPPDVIRVDEKNLREYYVPNLCGVVITTNHKGDGLYLPEDDRRHYVAWSPLTKDDFTAEYWQSLWGWYRDGGIGHVAAYLAERDISNFDAKAPPPQTDAFWDIVVANSAPEAAELTDALEKLGWRNAVTKAAVAEAAEESFGEWLRDRRNSRKVSHKMEECGYRAARNPSAKSGRWKVSGKDVVIYVLRTLSTRDGLLAAERLTREGEDVPF